MCQASLYDANVCFFTGTFQQHIIFASWECAKKKKKHKTMKHCKQVMFDVFLLCSFHCLCLIFGLLLFPYLVGVYV